MKPLLLFICTVLISSTIDAQSVKVTLSGTVKDAKDSKVLPFVTVALKNAADSTFVQGTITSDGGLFTFAEINPGSYVLETSYIGFETIKQTVPIGSLSPFLDLGTITLSEDVKQLNEVTVTGANADGVDGRMDKKTFSVTDNISQSGGSLLQVMKNLPGITTDQDGKVLIRGNDKVVVLIDGKQTALTGFGNQTGLDNIPASAIERIEVINNPSAKYDANGNAGIINIIYKKNKQEGFNGKIGLSTGLGALWIKNANFPDIRPQYRNTFKLNPSVSLNYRKNKTNIFFQGDYLHTPTLNKNEFTDRFYDDGSVVRQQLKRNRNTNIITGKTGLDWNINSSNTFNISALFSSEKIIDRGDEPFYNATLSERFRLWQFLEDELKTTVTATSSFQHKFQQPGHLLNLGLNYTFHREDEKYFFTNTLPASTGQDSFKLLSDESVFDLTADYVKPLKFGHIEGGIKIRKRYIPTNMQFFPGANSPIDSAAGGWANYNETIPAIYGNYIFEDQDFELEAGLRLEYVDLRYSVNPNHPTYKSSGYSYTQPFPNVRLAYKINDKNRVSLFYNRRVDRPNEVDIRIFPKYDDAEIIKVGNPGLRPQFTNTLEAGYKTSWGSGYIYAAFYHKMANGTITRIGSIAPGSTLIYNIFQNAGRSQNTGAEVIWQQQIAPWFSLTSNVNMYKNTIDAFTVENLYPRPNRFTADKQSVTSGSGKVNAMFKFKKSLEGQLSAVYLAPDIVPQGKTGSRFSVDAGMKKTVKKGEYYINATDLFNTLVIRRTVQGDGFSYVSNDYYETQVIRIGYSYKF
ncbi:TonB-dependent receptor domain-containing protein [Dyadobacter arcticus]|uniref:Outer membrane receptor protein involved in Fe transport n=1 Tax=Dyadobacter arcticus TaxID=1078754 RepID=A0ABX0UJJ5_9BACT|nr:TonB-dependent receptor [Dyadobacter arcticus]NIJ52663.1 outer membrane receptor protein involved in Fe transport [Dyadobacter arcticus]